MTIDELWELKFKPSNVLDYYDEITQFVSQTIDDKTREDYDIVSFLVDFEPCLEEIREYDRIVEFGQVLKQHNPKIYSEYFPYSNSSLCEHYCYHKNVEGLESCVDNYVEFPTSDYDLMMQMCRKMLAYEHIELVDKLISGTYEGNTADDSLFEGTTFEIALIKSHIELEKVYFNYKKTSEFEWETYRTVLTKFGFEIDEKFIKLCETGLTASIADVNEKARTDFEIDRRVCVETLQKTFMKYMYEEKNMRFPLSAAIWDHLYEYWERAEKHGKKLDDIDTYFEFDADTYKKYVTGQSGMILDYRFLSVVILWGTSYVYDFLKKIDYVEDVDYQWISDTLRKYKKQLIKENLGSLWNYDYINNWQKSDMETDEEKQEYKKITDEYYEADSKKIKQDSKEGFFIDPNRTSWLDSLGSGSKKTPDRIVERTYEPIIAGPKIGRNEKVTVEYEDGTIKKDVKYKKVQKDVETGKCKIV